MPPMSGAAGAAGAGGSGLSATRDSVVSTHGGDGSGVLQSGAGHLGGIDDAGGDHVAVLLLVGVEAVADLAGLAGPSPGSRSRPGRRWRRSGGWEPSRALATICTPVFSSPSTVLSQQLLHSGDGVHDRRCRRRPRCLPPQRRGWRSGRPRCAASSPSSRSRWQRRP